MTLNEFFMHQVPLSADAHERDVAAIRRSREAFAAALEPMQALEREYEAAIFPLDPEEPRTAAEMDVRQAAVEHLKVLREGAWGLGYRDLRLDQFDGGPGLNALVYWVSVCDTIIAHEEKLAAMQWPAPFRFIGTPGTTRIDGRLLRRGDVAMLSRSQAEAFGISSSRSQRK